MRITEDMKKRLRKSGIKPHAFHTRIRRGWAVDVALDTPPALGGKHPRQYFVVKNGNLKGVVGGTTEAAKKITIMCGGYRKITKNMVIGQIYRKGYALFEINGNKYAVGLAEETTGE